MQSIFGSRHGFSLADYCAPLRDAGIAFVWNAGAAVDSADYKPNGGTYSMQMHFNWCGEAKTPADRLKRYEKFWEMQCPRESDGYDDSLHVRTVRRCDYRLAQL